MARSLVFPIIFNSVTEAPRGVRRHADRLLEACLEGMVHQRFSWHKVCNPPAPTLSRYLRASIQITDSALRFGFAAFIIRDEPLDGVEYGANCSS